MTDVNAGPPQQPQPQPVPTSVALGQGRGSNGAQLVIVQVMTPTGMFVFFLDGPTARKVGGEMVGMAGGIVVAAPSPSGLVLQMLTAGRLLLIAAALRQIQEDVTGDGSLWSARVDLAAVAAQFEQEAGARAVRELRAQSMGNAA